MFGYIKPYPPELKIKEYDAFKSVYCGLCKQMSGSFNPFVKMTLSYDLVFLAIIQYSTRETLPTIGKGRCSANPFSKVVICEKDEVLGDMADASATMVYYKAQDNILDSKGFSKLLWRAISQLFVGQKDKAVGGKEELDNIFGGLIVAQTAVEQAETTSVDRASHPTGQAMEKLLSFLVEDSYSPKLEMERFGYLIGRFIYLCDAFADVKKDLKTGNFNPFVNKYGGEWEGDNKVLLIMERSISSLLMTIGEINGQLEKLEFSCFQPIIYNICQYGLYNSVMEIFATEGGNSNDYMQPSLEVDTQQNEAEGTAETAEQ